MHLLTQDDLGAGARRPGVFSFDVCNVCRHVLLLLFVLLNLGHRELYRDFY